MGWDWEDRDLIPDSSLGDLKPYEGTTSFLPKTHLLKFEDRPKSTSLLSIVNITKKRRRRKEMRNA